MPSNSLNSGLEWSDIFTNSAISFCSREMCNITSLCNAASPLAGDPVFFSLHTEVCTRPISSCHSPSSRAELRPAANIDWASSREIFSLSMPTTSSWQPVSQKAGFELELLPEACVFVRGESRSSSPNTLLAVPLLFGAFAASATDCASTLPVTVSTSDNKIQLAFAMTCAQLKDFIMTSRRPQVTNVRLAYMERRRTAINENPALNPIILLTSDCAGLEYPEKFYRTDGPPGLGGFVPRMSQNQPVAPNGSPKKVEMQTVCKHPRVQIVAREEDVEYVECKECGEVFESSEFKDMAIEENHVDDPEE
jgi:hypothetical protein